MLNQKEPNIQLPHQENPGDALQTLLLRVNDFFLAKEWSTTSEENPSSFDVLDAITWFRCFLSMEIEQKR